VKTADYFGPDAAAARTRTFPGSVRGRARHRQRKSRGPRALIAFFRNPFSCKDRPKSGVLRCPSSSIALAGGPGRGRPHALRLPGATSSAPRWASPEPPSASPPRLWAPTCPRRLARGRRVIPGGKKTEERRLDLASFSAQALPRRTGKTRSATRPGSPGLQPLREPQADGAPASGSRGPASHSASRGPAPRPRRAQRSSSPRSATQPIAPCASPRTVASTLNRMAMQARVGPAPRPSQVVRRVEGRGLGDLKNLEPHRVLCRKQAPRPRESLRRCRGTCASGTLNANGDGQGNGRVPALVFARAGPSPSVLEREPLEGQPLEPRRDRTPPCGVDQLQLLAVGLRGPAVRLGADRRSSRPRRGLDRFRWSPALQGKPPPVQGRDQRRVELQQRLAPVSTTSRSSGPPSRRLDRGRRASASANRPPPTVHPHEIGVADRQTASARPVRGRPQICSPKTGRTPPAGPLGRPRPGRVRKISLTA